MIPFAISATQEKTFGRKLKKTVEDRDILIVMGKKKKKKRK